MIRQMTKEPETGLTVVVKKKEAVPDRNPQRVVVTALIEYADLAKTMEVFEQMRDYLVDRGEARAILFFHNEENNSYLSLFTMGLVKPKELTEKQFESRLLQDYRQVNKNVIQVNVFYVKFNETFIGRVYLRTEQDGKDFLVDYPLKRAAIYRNYKELNAPITFNINVDIKTLRKIKVAEKKAKDTEDRIKKIGEARRENMRRPPGVYPAMPNMPMGLHGPPLVGGAVMGPGMVPGGMNMGGPPMGLGIPFNPQGVPGKMPMPFGGPQPGPGPALHDPRNKLKNILRDRKKF